MSGDERVRVGKLDGSNFGLQVTKPGVSFADSPAPESKDMLFDSKQNRHGIIHSTQSSSSGFNFFVDNGEANRPNVNGTVYLPLHLFFEKHYRQEVRKFGTNKDDYYSKTSTSYLSRLSDGATVQLTSSDTILDEQEYHAGGILLEKDFTASGGNRIRAISVGFKGFAGEHGARANRLTSYTTNTDLTLGFRAGDGSLTSNTFAVSTGSSYTLSGADQATFPVTNARGALLKIPCGYGFMNSTFMGF